MNRVSDALLEIAEALAGGGWHEFHDRIVDLAAEGNLNTETALAALTSLLKKGKEGARGCEICGGSGEVHRWSLLSGFAQPTKRPCPKGCKPEGGTP